MTVLSQIDSFLSSMGLNPSARAGIEGNMYVESSFNTSAYNAKEGAIGLAQWEGGRRTALQSYASRNGLSETDLGAQLGYLRQEINSGSYVSVNQLNAAGSPSAASAIWDTQFEKSAGSSSGARANAANAIYSGNPPSTGGSAGATDVPASGTATATNASLNWNLMDGFGIPGTILGWATDGVKKSIGTPIWNLVVTVSFVGLGGTLVIVGFAAMVKPAVNNASSKAAQLAPLAAL